jgi:hypothetical protein
MIRRFAGLLAAALVALAPVMALATALSITAANVSQDSGPRDSDQLAGEAFAAGAILYRKSSDSRWYKAQCDGTAEEAGSDDIGLALSTADAAGARLSIAKPGAVVSLGTGTAGTAYFIGRTAGAIIPAADLAQTDKATLIGLGVGTNKLLLGRLYHAGSVVP